MKLFYKRIAGFAAGGTSRQLTAGCGETII
jgi:hypothetical protein